MKKTAVLIVLILPAIAVFAQTSQNVRAFNIEAFTKLEAKKAFVIDGKTLKNSTQVDNLDTTIVTLGHLVGGYIKATQLVDSVPKYEIDKKGIAYGLVTGMGSKTVNIRLRDSTLVQFGFTDLVGDTVSGVGDTLMVALLPLDRTNDTLTLNYDVGTLTVSGSNLAVKPNVFQSKFTDGTGFLKNNGSGTWSYDANVVTNTSTSTDNAIARFHLTTGKIVQNSAATINDDGDAVFNGTIEANQYGYIRSYNDNNAANHAILEIGSNRGTKANPKYLKQGDESGAVAFRGATLGFEGGSGMNSLATEDWTADSLGSKLTFFTTPNASTTKQTRFVIEQNGKGYFGGNLGVGSFTRADYPLTITSDGNGLAHLSSDNDLRIWSQLVSGSARFYFQSATGVNSLINTNGSSYFMGGNFGINNNTPAYKLDVNGLIYSSSNVYAKEDMTVGWMNKTASNNIELSINSFDSTPTLVFKRDSVAESYVYDNKTDSSLYLRSNRGDVKIYSGSNFYVNGGFAKATNGIFTNLGNYKMPVHQDDTNGFIDSPISVSGNNISLSGTITASGGSSTNWNTAYSWGNHAAQGYLTSYTETDPNIYSWAKAATKPSYAWSEIGSKPTFATVATSGSYNDLTDKPTIPTNTNQLTNGAGFITTWTETDPTIYSWAKASAKPSYTWSEITSKPAFATVATSGSYTDLSNKPTIPTNTNQLTNGAGFITEVPATSVSYPKISTYNEATDGYSLVYSQSLNSLVWAARALDYDYVENPMTAKGDIIVGGTSGYPERLAAGTDGYVLRTNGAGYLPSWQPNSSSLFTDAGTYTYLTSASDRLLLGYNSDYNNQYKLVVAIQSGTNNSISSAGNIVIDSPYGLILGSGTSLYPNVLSLGEVSSVGHTGNSGEYWVNTSGKPMFTGDSGTVDLTNAATVSSGAPASASASGTAGEIRYDSNYIYICIAANTWKRSALTTW